MTREELEKEAKRFCIDKTHYCIGGFGGDAYCEGYINSAEPREKQIRALQKQNGELTDKVKELEKENAELNNFIIQSKKDGISPINALIIKNLGNQLTKAKEIIKNLLVYVPVDLKEYEEAKAILK